MKDHFLEGISLADCWRKELNIAEAEMPVLVMILMGMRDRPVTLLDGGAMRIILNCELGFSKERREFNIQRADCATSEITKNSGIAICNPIAPYTAPSRALRETVGQYLAFVETYEATPLEECKRRDRKYLYKLAREGKLKEFIGVNDPNVEPETSKLKVSTEGEVVDNCVHQMILRLDSVGLIEGE